MLFLKELKINMSQITLHVEKQYVEKTIVNAKRNRNKYYYEN